MTRDEVIAAARTVVEERGWPWEEPVVVLPRRRFVFFGPRTWEVTRSARGRNWSVRIDDRTGRLVGAGCIPR